ncbi:MAG: hypothetical protein IKS28_04170, partial [Clostridia bacterium]|nr:hypothetical protein [Clostridia bacterium]
MLLCGCSVNKDNQATGEDGKAMEEEKRNPGVDEKFPSYVPVGSEYNVKDFGAAGDGVTDDSAAVLEAVAKVKEKVGGTVYFPDGQYRITEKVTFGSECILAFDDGACLMAEAPVRVNGYVKSDSHILFRGEGEYSYSLKNPYVTPVWFGAEGDGRTDDTEAFTAAIAMSEEIYIPATDAGYVVGELKLAKPIRIVGIPSESGEKPALVGKEGIDSLFKFIANNIYINCLRIEMGNT